MIARVTSVVLILLQTSANLASNISGVIDLKFFGCPQGFLLRASTVAIFRSRSTQECILRCWSLAECMAVNVVSVDTPDHVICTFLTESSSNCCEGLSEERDVGCFHLRRVCNVSGEETSTADTTQNVATTSQEPLVCLNGGTKTLSRCLCPLTHGGKSCERLIRDCSEPSENGYSYVSSRTMDIQPMTSPTPFKVFCNFNWGGITYPLRRLNSGNINLNWTTAKSGFAGDLTTSAQNYFIGLEHMHRLLQQATYRAHIYVQYNWFAVGDAFYDQFKVANESSSYEIFTGSFYTPLVSSLGNGFAGVSPIPFCTTDHDCNNCARQRNYSGWFDSNCNGYNLFSDLKWPGIGQIIDLNLFEINLVRSNPFADN